MKFFLILIVTLSSSVVFAQDDPIEVANEAYVAGMKAYDSGEFEVAIEHLARSNSLFPRAVLSYNIALAQFKLLRFSEGLREAERAREMGLDESLVDKLNARTTAVEIALDAQKVSTVVSATNANSDTSARDPIDIAKPSKTEVRIPVATWIVGTFGIVSLGFAGFAEFRVQSFAESLERFSRDGPQERYDAALASVKNWQLAGRFAVGLGVASLVSAVGIAIFFSERITVAASAESVGVTVRF